MRGQTEQEQQNVREHFSIIKVIPIDMDKLNSDIDKQFRTAVKEGKLFIAKGRDSETGKEQYYTIEEFKHYHLKVKGTYGLGFVKDTTFPIDQEAIMYKEEKDNKFLLEVYMEEKPRKDGSFNIELFPVASTKIPIANLIKDYGKEETDLPTFMADRFNYNSRIASNMNEVYKFLKKEKVING